MKEGLYDEWKRTGANEDIDFTHWLCSEINKARAALSSAPVAPAEKIADSMTNYSIALQRAIEHYCRGVVIPEAIAKDCPHYAEMLNSSLHPCAPAVAPAVTYLGNCAEVGCGHNMRGKCTVICKHKEESCTHDPRTRKGAIGMYHCPECGQMVVAGVEHPKKEKEV